MASHDFNDTNGGLFHTEGLVVTDDFLHAGCDIFSCGTVSRAVIGYRQVIVNCLGNTHEALRLIVSSRIIGQHLHRIHGVISACVEKTLNIMLFHDFEYFFVYFLMSFNLRHFETAGA